MALTGRNRSGCLFWPVVTLGLVAFIVKSAYINSPDSALVGIMALACVYLLLTTRRQA